MIFFKIDRFWLNILKNLLNFSRKSRLFNKSRYSRNRQNVRVTFYFGLYFNVLIIYTVFSLFYNLSVLLSYNWWVYFICFSFLILTSIIRIIKKKLND